MRYIEDEDGDVIGFVLMEDGEEAEYYYVEEDEEEAEEEDNPYDLGITKEGVAEATNDMNAIYKDGIAWRPSSRAPSTTSRARSTSVPFSRSNKDALSLQKRWS